MAAISQNGSRSGPAPGQKTIVNTDDVLSETSYVKDTFLQRTAIDPETYAGQHKAMQGFAAGHRVIVQFYMRTENTVGKRTHTTDISTVRNPIHQQHVLIKNLEITLPEAVQHEYEQNSTESQVTGTAIMYPGLVPLKGSVFLMPIGDGQTGFFMVNSVERLSLRQGTNHRIGYHLVDTLTDELRAMLDETVIDTVYFEKGTYLGDGQTLLNSESYVGLKALQNLRRILITYYTTTFYDDVMNTYMPPSGIYDPYLIQFLHSKISLAEANNRPAQLYPNPSAYHRTIWNRLLEPFTLGLFGVRPDFDIVVLSSSRYDVGITPLINRKLVRLRNRDDDIPGQDRTISLVETKENYVLSKAFYDDDQINMSPIEKVIHESVFTRKISDIETLIKDHLNTFSALSDDEQFYMIPLYLHLIDVAIATLTKKA